MTTISSREEFKEFCLRKLGHPVIKINVTDEQVEDRIDDALSRFFEYHFEGTKKEYLAIKLTATDISEKRIPVPENSFSILRVFSVSGFSPQNISYVAAISDILDNIRTGKEGGLSRYYIVEQHLSLIQQLFVREPSIRFNRYEKYLYLDTDWNKFNVDDYLIVEAWLAIDPDQFTAVWNDWWLKQYASALIKMQWGQNMLKYQGFELPTGITLNGRDIYDDAVKEIEELEEKLREEYSYPIDFFIG